ncbi:MAG: hypothetical protein NVSMB64_19470 [Candidatus Velthaea sp.]
MNHYTEDILIDYIHGEVSPAEDVRIHAHLAACDACRITYDAQAAIGDLLRASARAEEREFPSLIKARVWEAVRAEQPAFADRVRALLRPVFVLPAAAALAIAAYLGVPALHTIGAHGTPTVAAAFYLEEHAAEGQQNPLADHTNVNATFAVERNAVATTTPLIDAADAATLTNDLVSGN